MCCLSSESWMQLLHEWEDCRISAISNTYLPLVMISKSQITAPYVRKDRLNPPHGERKRYLAWFDDSRGFSPSQAASTAGSGIKPICLRALPSFFIIPLPWVSQKVLYTALNVRLSFQKPELVTHGGDSLRASHIQTSDPKLTHHSS